MLKYIFKRIIWMPVLLLMVSLIVFFLALNIDKRYSTEKIVGKSVDDFEIKFLNNKEVFKKQDLTKGKLYGSIFMKKHPEILSIAWKKLCEEKLCL